MLRIAIVLLLLSGLLTPAFGQDRLLEPAMPPADREAADGPEVRHATDLTSPEAQAALRAFHEAKAAGLLPRAAKTGAAFDLGDTRNFNVILRNSDGTNERWEARSFVLKATHALFNIWVDAEHLTNGNVTAAEIETLRAGLAERTPAGSVNPNLGIFANNHAAFGSPPNYDGDGKVDVLLYNIEPRSVLGFVHSIDIYPSAPAGRGNQRDVLYLDAVEGTASLNTLQAIAAHEYAHLIHFNYLTSSGDFSFMMEGVAEYAIVLNGFGGWRGTRFLHNLAEHNTRLLAWRDDQSEVNFADYERSGLFTEYLALQAGRPLLRSIVQSRSQTMTAIYREALQAAGYNLNDLVANFHTANLLNDTRLDARFGYAPLYRQGIRTMPTRTYNGASSSSTTVTGLAIETGAVQYLSWTGVRDFRFQADIGGNVAEMLRAGMRTRLRIRAVLKPVGGGTEVRDFTPGAGEQMLAGEYERVTLAIIHHDVTRGSVSSFDVNAAWVASAFATETVAYEDGAFLTGRFFSLRPIEGGAGAATRFVRPASHQTTLSKVWIAPLYLSQFSNGGQPAEAPRDFMLKIWASTGGRPGAELFTLTTADPRPYSALKSLTVDFAEIDLSAYAAELSALPDTFYIGYVDAGADGNTQVAGVASSAKDVSFIRSGSTSSVGGWRRLWDVTLTGSTEEGVSMTGTAVPIRAEFKLSVQPVATEDEPVLPETAVLHQNYPNPFNPTTTLSYTLPAAADVRLAVYDVLGRRVALLAEGVQAAGLHEAHVDARGWTSGVYFYVLEADGRQQTRTMVLMK